MKPIKFPFSLWICVAVLLNACASSDTKEERMKALNKALPQMSCRELLSEKEYQKTILDGLVKRQQNEITPADVVAGALMSGVNAGMNVMNKEDRNDRIIEIQEKIALIEAATRRKGCL